MKLFMQVQSLKISVLFVLSSLVISCSNNENPSKKELESLLYNYHKTNTSQKDLDNDIDLLISKDFNFKYKGLFYKIKNSNKHYVGFVDNDGNIVKAIQLKQRKAVSIFDNRLCLVSFDKKRESIVSKEGDDCFTLFVGEIPYEGFTNIELEWGCSKGALASEKLVEGKYFFILKEGVTNNICNLKLTGKEKETEHLFYNIENGLFTKKSIAKMDKTKVTKTAQ